MTELSVGATPRELIPGDIEAIAQLGRRLEDIAVGCREAADQLSGLRAADWSGEAAEAFADALDQEPGKYARAADAFKDAALAVHRYVSLLEEAQLDAQRAIHLFEEATARQSQTPAQVEAQAPRPETVDADITHARSILTDARERVEHEAGIAARTLADAAEAAPNKPSWGKRFLDGAGEFVGGAAEATWGTAKFAWSVSNVRMATDPMGWVRDVKGIGEGLVWGASHPVEFGKEILDWETWKENPARAAGRLAPEIALTLATAGAGAGAKAGSAAKKAVGAAKKARSAKKARAAQRAVDAADEARTAQRAANLAEHKPRRSPKMDEARRARLNQDWDHDGKITANSKKEAEIGEDLEARGILTGVERPAHVSGQGDLLDASGRWWDVKGPQSRESVEELKRAHARSRGLPEPTFDPTKPLRGQFDLNDQVGKIEDMVGKSRGVILDHRGLNDDDFRLLKEAIQRKGMSDDVIWYP